MNLVPYRQDPFASMKQDLQQAEQDANAFANQLTQSNNVSQADALEAKKKFQQLEIKAGLLNAYWDTVHRIMMKILQSMSH